MCFCRHWPPLHISLVNLFHCVTPHLLHYNILQQSLLNTISPISAYYDRIRNCRARTRRLARACRVVRRMAEEERPLLPLQLTPTLCRAPLKMRVNLHRSTTRRRPNRAITARAVASSVTMSIVLPRGSCATAAFSTGGTE